MISSSRALCRQNHPCRSSKPVRAETLSIPDVPTIFSHAIAVAAAVPWYRTTRGRFYMWTAIAAMLPDADVVSFLFGVPYEHMFGHRGFTHSLFFAAMVGLVAAVASVGPAKAGPYALGAESPTSSRIRLFVWFTLVAASHGILDALTNGGRGIAFFAPFSDHRYFFPWRPIQVSPIGVGFFSARGLRFLASEGGWVWVASS